jgi:hypothetical protein
MNTAHPQICRCCGREQTHCVRTVQPSIRRIEDPHHPRGFRELRSPAEMRKLLKRRVTEQKGIRAICHEEFTDYNDIVPDHRDAERDGRSANKDRCQNLVIESDLSDVESL